MSFISVLIIILVTFPYPYLNFAFWIGQSQRGMLNCLTHVSVDFLISNSLLHIFQCSVTCFRKCHDRISLWITSFISVKWLPLYYLMPCLWILLWYGYWYTCIFSTDSCLLNLPIRSHLTFFESNCLRLCLMENI